MPSTGECGEIADRIGALLRRGRQARAASGTNWRAMGSCGSSRIDQGRHRRADGDGIALRDRARCRACDSAARSARPHKFGGACGWYGSTFIGSVSGTGAHITCSIREAPVASITRRSKPSAMPLASGICGERGQKILVDRIAFAIDPHLLRHLDLEAAALLGRVRQFAEGVREFDAAGIKLEPLGHPRIARRSAGRAPPRRPGIRRGSWRGRGRDCGSTRSTMTRLKRSDQVSSSATRRPAALQRWRRDVSRSVAPSGRWWPEGRCRQSAKTPRRRQALRLLKRIGFAAAIGEGAASRPSRPRAPASRRNPASGPRRSRRPGTIPAS